MSHELVWEKEGLKITTVGKFGNAFLDASIKATTDDRFVNAKYSIVDFLNVNEYPIDSDTIRRITEHDAKAYKINPNMKLAVLTNKDVMTGLTNMYKAYLEINNHNKTWDVKTFKTEVEAREWLSA